MLKFLDLQKLSPIYLPTFKRITLLPEFEKGEGVHGMETTPHRMYTEIITNQHKLIYFLL